MARGIMAMELSSEMSLLGHRGTLPPVIARYQFVGKLFGIYARGGSCLASVGRDRVAPICLSSERERNLV